MRKLFALAMVAVLSLTIALAVLGCGQKADQSSTESTTPTEQSSSMPADSGAAMSDSGMGHMGSDSTGMK
jgi:hypothetical protein